MQNLDSDTFDRITSYCSTLDVHNLIKSCYRFKEFILLEKYQNKSIKYIHDVEPYVFNLNVRNYDYISNIQERNRKLGVLVKDFEKLLDIPNCILSGGSVVSCLDSKISCDDVKNSKQDLDFFLYGSSESITIALKKCIEILDDLSPLYCIRSNCIDVLISGKRNIQIIVTNDENPYNVVSNFDFAYCQSYVENKTFYSVNIALSSFRYRKTYCCKNEISRDRLDKVRKKGFEIDVDDNVEIQEISKITSVNRFVLNKVKIEVDSENLCDETNELLKSDMFKRKLDENDLENVLHYDSVYEEGKLNTCGGFKKFSNLTLNNLSLHESEATYKKLVREHKAVPLLIETGIICLKKCSRQNVMRIVFSEFVEFLYSLKSKIQLDENYPVSNNVEEEKILINIEHAEIVDVFGHAILHYNFRRKKNPVIIHTSLSTDYILHNTSLQDFFYITIKRIIIL